MLAQWRAHQNRFPLVGDTFVESVYNYGKLKHTPQKQKNWAKYGNLEKEFVTDHLLFCFW